MDGFHSLAHSHPALPPPRAPQPPQVRTSPFQDTVLLLKFKKIVTLRYFIDETQQMS